MADPTFLLSPEASDDLLAIADYIARESGMLRAQGVVERISRTLGAIAYTPNAGRPRLDLDGAPLLFPVPPWLILYEPEPGLSGIYILRIYDGRRDLERLFRAYQRPRRLPRK